MYFNTVVEVIRDVELDGYLFKKGSYYFSTQSFSIMKIGSRQGDVYATVGLLASYDYFSVIGELE